MALHASDVDGGDTAELRGALPPSGPDDASEESSHQRESQVESEGSALLSGLKRWGPWKRWSLYREDRQHERDEPKYWRDRDSKENARSRLPDDESVQVPAIWVAELYTPSTVGGLLKGIGDLGWEYGRTRDDSLSKWMSDVREGRQAGWTKLGLVSPPGSGHFMRERTAPLPPKVKAALPILMSLTPSLTAFIVVFLFDDDVAASLETPLRDEFTTTIRRDPLFRPWHVIRYVLMNGPIRLGYRIYDPGMIRREAVKARLQELEDGCVQWVQRCLPGAFSSMPGSRLPTAALLVTEQTRPLTEEASEVRAFDGLAINRDYDAWESDQWPGGRLVLPRGWDNEGNRLVFACRRRDAFPESPGYRDPTSNWTIAQRANAYIWGLLSRWAVACLQDSYHEALSELRDRTAQEGRYRPVSDLKKLRSLARTTLYDINACSQEILDFVKSDRHYLYAVMEMTYAGEVRGENQELLDDLRSAQEQRAQQVQRDASLLQSTLSTINDLSQTITNIRLQRLVVLLTLASIAIAFWVAYLTFNSTP